MYLRHHLLENSAAAEHQVLLTLLDVVPLPLDAQLFDGSFWSPFWKSPKCCSILATDLRRFRFELGIAGSAEPRL